MTDKAYLAIRWADTGLYPYLLNIQHSTRAYPLLRLSARQRNALGGTKLLPDTLGKTVKYGKSMMPWNYTNTTGNFRRLAERLGSDRIKVMWGPADNYNCGEWDAVTTGF